MLLRNEVNRKIDELKGMLGDVIDDQGRNLQGVIDGLQAATALWEDKHNSIAAARDKLDEAERTANLELLSRINEGVVTITALKLALAVTPEKKKEDTGNPKQDDPPPSDNKTREAARGGNPSVVGINTLGDKKVA